MDDFFQLKNYISKIVDFSTDEMNAFTSKMKICTYKKNTFILEEGKLAKSIFFINKGLTRNVSIKKDGSEASLFFSLENTFVTEYASFLQNTPAIYGIQCIEESEIIEIPKESIEQAYIHIKDGNKLGRLIAEHYFVMLTKFNYESQIKDPLQIYSELEKKFQNIHQRIPQHMIASYLGISSVHLSRLKSESITKRKQ